MLCHGKFLFDALYVSLLLQAGVRHFLSFMRMPESHCVAESRSLGGKHQDVSAFVSVGVHAVACIGDALVETCGREEGDSRSTCR